MIAKKYAILLSIIAYSTTLFASIDIYFSPNGGFAPVNNERTIQMADGSVRPANLNDALLSLIEHIEPGSTIKMAMYSFDIKPIQDALIAAARDREVHVKLLMDAIMGYTAAMRAPFYQKILAEHAKAKAEGRVFDFQVREMKPQSMKDRGRFVVLADGTERVGTMHEKFAIILPRGCKIPLHGFCGSANVTGLAGTMYGENRVFFHDEPAMGRQLAEEFARLWNEYGSNVTEVTQTESYVPANVGYTDVHIISNSKPVNEDELQKLDVYILDMLEKVYKRGGEINIAMFSFTHHLIADKLLDLAERYPEVTIKLLVDMQQMDLADQKDSLVPKMERMIKIKRLNNFQIRYRWRSNAFTWDHESDSFKLLHFRDPLLHHKCGIVNRNRMALGSFNWTWGGERRNFENIMLYNGTMKEQKQIIDRFLAEFDTLWDSLKVDGKVTKQFSRTDPQVVTAKQGFAIREQIRAAFNDPDCKKIMDIIDPYIPFNPNVPPAPRVHIPCTFEYLLEQTKLSENVLKEKIDILENATLILCNEAKEYVLAD